MKFQSAINSKKYSIVHNVDNLDASLRQELQDIAQNITYITRLTKGHGMLDLNHLEAIKAKVKKDLESLITTHSGAQYYNISNGNGPSPENESLFTLIVKGGCRDLLPILMKNDDYNYHEFLCCVLKGWYFNEEQTQWFLRQDKSKIVKCFSNQQLLELFLAASEYSGSVSLQFESLRGILIKLGFEVSQQLYFEVLDNIVGKPPKCLDAIKFLLKQGVDINQLTYLDKSQVIQIKEALNRNSDYLLDEALLVANMITKDDKFELLKIAIDLNNTSRVEDILKTYPKDVTQYHDNLLTGHKWALAVVNNHGQRTNLFKEINVDGEPVYYDGRQKYDGTAMLKLFAKYAPKMLNMTKNGSQTALGAAVETQETDLVKLLLELGADVNLGGGTLGGGTQTPLCIAARNENLKIFKLLLENGADVYLAREEVMHFCVSSANSGNPVMLDALLAHGADPQLYLMLNNKTKEPDTLVDIVNQIQSAHSLELKLNFKQLNGDEIEQYFNKYREFFNDLDYTSGDGEHLLYNWQKSQILEALASQGQGLAAVKKMQDDVMGDFNKWAQWIMYNDDFLKSILEHPGLFFPLTEENLDYDTKNRLKYIHDILLGPELIKKITQYYELLKEKTQDKEELRKSIIQDFLEKHNLAEGKRCKLSDLYKKNKLQTFKDKMQEKLVKEAFDRYFIQGSEYKSHVFAAFKVLEETKNSEHLSFKDCQDVLYNLGITAIENRYIYASGGQSCVTGAKNRFIMYINTVASEENNAPKDSKEQEEWEVSFQVLPIMRSFFEHLTSKNITLDQGDIDAKVVYKEWNKYIYNFLSPSSINFLKPIITKPTFGGVSLTVDERENLLKKVINQTSYVDKAVINVSLFLQIAQMFEALEKDEEIDLGLLTLKLGRNNIAHTDTYVILYQVQDFSNALTKLHDNDQAQAQEAEAQKVKPLSIESLKKYFMVQAFKAQDYQLKKILKLAQEKCDKYFIGQDKKSSPDNKEDQIVIKLEYGALAITDQLEKLVSRILEVNETEKLLSNAAQRKAFLLKQPKIVDGIIKECNEHISNSDAQTIPNQNKEKFAEFVIDKVNQYGEIDSTEALNCYKAFLLRGAFDLGGKNPDVTEEDAELAALDAQQETLLQGSRHALKSLPQRTSAALLQKYPNNGFGAKSTSSSSVLPARQSKNAQSLSSKAPPLSLPQTQVETKSNAHVTHQSAQNNFSFQSPQVPPVTKNSSYDKLSQGKGDASLGSAPRPEVKTTQAVNKTAVKEDVKPVADRVVQGAIKPQERPGLEKHTKKTDTQETDKKLSEPKLASSAPSPLSNKVIIKPDSMPQAQFDKVRERIKEPNSEVQIQKVNQIKLNTLEIMINKHLPYTREALEPIVVQQVDNEFSNVGPDAHAILESTILGELFKEF
jgi:hypothetical protein